MQGLTYFAGMMVLFAAMIFGQSSPSTPSSDPSNSSSSSAQSQDGISNPDRPAQAQTNSGATKSQEGTAQPDTTVRDQQNSTTSTAGANGESNTPPSSSNMGTSSNSNKKMEGTEQEPSTQPKDKAPRNGNSVDQQPNSSSSPNSAPPQAFLIEGPAARAVSTHTPDPGTCMNPAALQDGQAGTNPPC
jgi:hypothetical protein